MDILHYLDVAIGFSLSMMVLATLVGTTTAMWLAAIRTQVRNLELGLQRVLSVFGDALTEAERLEIAKSVLNDKLMNGWLRIAKLGMGSADAVGREEFVLMLLRRAGEGGAWAKVGAVIQARTGQTAADLLQKVEQAMLAAEAANPAALASVSRMRAIHKEASAVAAPLFAQFDDVMMRSEDNTAFSSKLVSALMAFVFVVAFPVNSFDLLARLMHDEAITKSLAELAAKDPRSPDLMEAVKSQGLFGKVFASDYPPRVAFKNSFLHDPFGSTGTLLGNAASEPGVWTTFFLVSLGAPFWQNLLTKLLGLKSKFTAKTENDRKMRAEQT